MKNLFAIALLLCAITLLSFVVIDYELKSSTAEVNQLQGLYIFTDSKPVKEYDYLGTEKLLMTASAQYSNVRDGLVKKVKKAYPQADGVILSFTTVVRIMRT